MLYENKIKEVNTMAVNKVPNSASLSIEVQKDIDKAYAQLT